MYDDGVNVSVLRVLNEIAHVDSNALPKIEVIFDRLIEEEKNRKRTIRDIFHSKSFWQGFQDGLAAPLFLFDSLVSRHPRQPPVREKRDADVIFWKAIGEYCSGNSEILDQVSLHPAEQEKLNAYIRLPVKTQGQHNAFTPT